MFIQKQTGLTRPPVEAYGPALAPDAEWTASPLRPIARWVLVALEDGAARLEMVWHVPEPRAADAF